MALSDIIAAIKAQAENEIALLQEQLLRDKNDYKRKVDEELATYEQDLQKQSEEKKKALISKANTMVQTERRKVLLTEKRNALDTVYAMTLEEIQKLPKDKLKKVEDALEEKVKGKKGEKKAGKNGGFLFVSSKSTDDYTFERLVNETLRPQTELDVASQLFA